MNLFSLPTAGSQGNVRCGRVQLCSNDGGHRTLTKGRDSGGNRGRLLQVGRLILHIHVFNFKNLLLLKNAYRFPVVFY